MLADRCAATYHATTAAAIESAVGTGAVPRHTDEETTIVTIVSWPPVLRIRHEREQILLERGI